MKKTCLHCIHKFHSQKAISLLHSCCWSCRSHLHTHQISFFSKRSTTSSNSFIHFRIHSTTTNERISCTTDREAWLISENSIRSFVSNTGSSCSTYTFRMFRYRHTILSFSTHWISSSTLSAAFSCASFELRTSSIEFAKWSMALCASHNRFISIF